MRTLRRSNYYLALHVTCPCLGVCLFFHFHTVSEILERDGVPEQLLRTTRSPLLKIQNLLLNSMYQNYLFDLRPANHVRNIYVLWTPANHHMAQ